MLENKILDATDEIGEKKLIISFPPVIKCYLPYSVLSSIICANEQSLNWIYNNFIQLYHNGFGKEDYFPNADFAYQDKLCLSVTELNQFNYKMNIDTIVDDIKFWIDNKNYLVLYLSEIKIPNVRFHNVADVIHSQFIFGYSESKKVFYLMNFGNESQKLEVVEFKYQDLVDALEYTIELNRERKYKKSTTMRDYGRDFRIVLLKYNECQSEVYNNDINIEYIEKQLYDFVECRNSSNQTSYFTSFQTGKWGLDTYDEIKKQFELTKEKGERLDFRFMFMLYEHKVLMAERMLIISKLFGVSDFRDDMNIIVKQSELLKNMVFKYNFRQSDHIYRKIINDIDELKSIEYDTYKRYLEELKKIRKNRDNI